MNISESFLLQSENRHFPVPALPAHAASASPDIHLESAGAETAARVKRLVGIRISWKLAVVFGVLSATIVFFVLVAIGRQLAVIDQAAMIEARHVAQGIADTALDIGMANGDRLQEYTVRLGNSDKRDVVIVDTQKKGIADYNAHERGELFESDANGEVALTLKDGLMRHFIERNEEHPEGARQIVIPIRQHLGAAQPTIIGAVVLEYTPMRDEMFAAARNNMLLIVLAGAALILFIICIGVGVSRHITHPLSSLQEAVSEINHSNYNTRVAIESTDEIGVLGQSFNAMAEALGSNHATLLEHKALLEQRIADRTAELTVANASLKAEVQERKVAAERIEFLAYYDSLTKLPNRGMFSRLLGDGVAAARESGLQLSILFVDLDRFKNINDTLGHAAGDQLLQEVAGRFSACLRPGDAVARLGGDEFVVLLPEFRDASEVAVIAQKLLNAASKPFAALGQDFHVTASVGISCFPKDGEDERALMKHADIAMYRAKDEGKNNFQFYTAELNTHSFERLALESNLRRALERDEFQLHYQPKIDAGTGKVHGMEALLRWQHPDLGLVSPVKFIPIAEETGLIVAIGRWVLRTACAQNVKWRELGIPPMCVAVNLSARQFTDENLLSDITAILEETGMDPRLLELEITESMLMRDLDKAIATLHSLKKMGMRLAIDDFGTGYSSLSNLKKFPIDTIKVDRSFVRDLPGRAEDRSITEAIIAMGRALSLTVVAEGVETLAQADFLREQFCDEFQGFYFSKPLTVTDFQSLMQKTA